MSRTATRRSMRVAVTVVAIASAMLLCWYVVFPWLDRILPAGY